VPATALAHDIGRHLPELARFDSSGALARSALWPRIAAEVEAVLAAVVVEDPRREGEPAAAVDGTLRALAWNIERGGRLDDVVDCLRREPRLAACDLLLLTELDHGMARSHNRFVARDLALALGMAYAFAPCYLALSKGSGLEARVEGENTLALHGNAVVSRHPLRDCHSLALPNGKDLMRGREKRLGSQRAVVATVLHPAGPLRAVSVHLDAHSSQRHRYRQMCLVLDHLDRLEPRLPVLIGGDWNTSTYDSSRALYAILGYWLRLAMGVRNVIENHYPHPDRWFERHLFAELGRRGYRWRDLNQAGACTWHYDVRDLAVNSNLREWIPGWCFWFIEQALRVSGGRCGLKLDWFAGRDLEPDPAAPPAVVRDLGAVSDHDPIAVGVRLAPVQR
jgi:endonuclease/exonuclease/phosphatase family metal-dependent hydrolase